MDLKEIQKKKKQLGKDIFHLMTNFKNETSLDIDDIYCHTTNVNSLGDGTPQSMLIGVDIKVKI